MDERIRERALMRHGRGRPEAILFVALLLAALTGCGSVEPAASPTEPRTSPRTATATGGAGPTSSARATATGELASTPDAPSDDGMEITVSKDVYRRGEEITFTIRNDSDQALYYDYGGCDWPTVTRLEGGDWVSIGVNNTEHVPGPTELAPGERRVCSWDQDAWQDLEQEGAARFRTYRELAPVPPGLYRFVVRYYSDWADALAFQNPQTTGSRIFSIE